MTQSAERPERNLDAEPYDISTLVQLSLKFRSRLDEARRRIAPAEFQWYPYDTLSNLHTLDRLLTGPSRFLMKLAADRPILDVGCADGDLAFFLASLGFKVLAIDYPIQNFNAMRGLRALHREFGGLVDIRMADLEGSFELPERGYGLGFLLGVLYHLKNPWNVLDILSRHLNYALISTSITSYVPGLYETVAGTSLAYLADVYELNRDSTNYWVFSDAGFRRLLRRTNWEICDYLLTGSPLVTGAVAEQRAFALVRSRFAEGKIYLLLGKGWHEPEEQGWRWTERHFAVRFEGLASTNNLELSLTAFVADALVANCGSITLEACANGVELEPGVFSGSGMHVYRRNLTAVPLFAGDLRIDFSLSSALPPDPQDPRERGIVVPDLQVVSR